MRLLCLVLLIVFAAVGCCWAQTNLAVGIPVSFDKQPSYELCTDPEDHLQLTDGKSAGDKYWTDKLMVGWRTGASVTITIDLGDIKPLSGMMFRAPAGKGGGVYWPRNIFVFVSDDNLTYRLAGDLVDFSRETGLPEMPESRGYYEYKTTSLKTHGRYVKFHTVSGGGQIFCDEIEVYKGDDSFLTATTNEEIVQDIQAFVSPRVLKSAVVGRLHKDIRDLKNLISDSRISKSAKNKLLGNLEAYDRVVPDIAMPNPDTFTTIFPFNSLQADILGTFGELLSLQNLSELVFWKKHRYDALQLFEMPRDAKAQISIDALDNEFRSDAFLVTNATSRPITAILTLEGLAGLEHNQAIEVCRVPWTDTCQYTAVTSALPPAPKTINNGYRITLPAGLTTPIWFTLDSSLVAPGTYKGNVVLRWSENPQKVPITIRVSNVQIKRPRLSVCMWDYAHSSGFGAINRVNMESAIALMKSHYLDSPWATRAMLPRTGNYGPEYFAELDKWIKMWPDARNYMCLAAVNSLDKEQNANLGSDEFNEYVGKWAMAVDQHLRSIGIDPANFYLLLVDEPTTDAQDELIVAWIKAIRASGSKLSFYQDPLWLDPGKNKIQEAMTLPEIICPHMQFYYRGPQSAKDYYRELRDSGKKIWFFQTSSNVHTFDPAEYYRLMAWHAFKAGFVGIGYWAFGDTSGSKNAWNGYEQSAHGYAPAFIDPKTVTDSAQWQAVRDAVLDYEYLAMLKDAAEATTDAKLKEDAQKLLNEAVETVTANYVEDYQWKDTPKHQLVDDYRVKIIRMLERLRK